MYNVRLLDQNRRRIAVIEAPASWRYTRRPSEATNISVALPRTLVEDALPTGMDVHAFLSPAQVVYAAAAERPQNVPKHKHAQIGRFVQIYRGARHVITGRITKVNIAADTITVQCHTEEIVLESHVTPAQYGRKWDHWDLADIARDMLRGWHVMRVKDRTQWESAIERVNVDTSTEPGVVMLAKSSGRYVSQGHITLRFAKADVPDFVAWDRIRWASDNGAPVRTTMQYRYGDGTSMGAWSDEVEGALPDEIGVVPGTTDAEVIDVRINLYTEDRDTEDAEGNAVGQTPYVFAVEMVARTTGALTAGDIPAVAGVTVSGLEADGASALNVLSQACAQAGWEFWVSDGKLNVANQMGEDRTDSVLLRAGTNMSVQQLSEGDDELVNVLTAYGPGDGINRLQVTRRHEESIAKYGEHHGRYEFAEVSTLDDLIQAADEYLDEHAAPVPAYQVEALYPYGTEPEFGCGDYVRVADPRNGIVTKSRIAEEQRDYSASGLRTTLYLGVPAPSLARQVRPAPPPREVAPPARPEISVSTIAGGIRVVDTRAPKTKWLTTECHVSDEPDFERTADTLVDNARKSRFDVLGLTPGTRYYAQLVRIDPNGNESVSDVRSAVAGDYREAPDLTPPAAPTGLTAIPVVGGFVLTWDRHEGPPPLDRYVLERASSADGYATWEVVNAEIRSAHYSDLGLDSATQYQYRLTVISRAQVPSLPSDPTTPALPGRVSLASQVTDRLARGDLAEDIIEELDGIATIESNLEDLTGEVSAVVQTADELSQTVAQVEDGLATAQSELVQHANAISQRVTTVQEQTVIEAVLDALPTVGTNTLTASRDREGNPIDWGDVDPVGKHLSATIHRQVGTQWVDYDTELITTWPVEEFWSDHWVGFANPLPPTIKPGCRVVLQTTSYGTFEARVVEAGDYYLYLDTRSPSDEVTGVVVTVYDGAEEPIYEAETIRLGEITARAGNTLTFAGEWTEEILPEHLDLDWVIVSEYVPVTAAQIVVAQQDSRGRILLDGDVLVPKSIGVRELRTLGGGVEVGDEGVTVNHDGTKAFLLGNVAGLPYGPDDAPLPQQPGFWGDRDAGLFLRGYAALLDFGSADDEDLIPIPNNAINPQIIVSPKEMLSYSPANGVLTHQFVDAFREGDAFRIKAKSIIRGDKVTWPSRANARGSWSYVQPQTADPNGRKGVWTEFVICRPSWWISWAGFGAYRARLWMDVTDEYDANGDPINWTNIRSWTRTSTGEGTLNWDTSLPHYGQWAVRVRGDSTNPVATYVTTGVSSAGYRAGDEYLSVDGSKISGPDPSNTPSGMSVLYFILDRG